MDVSANQPVQQSLAPCDLRSAPGQARAGSGVGEPGLHASSRPGRGEHDRLLQAADRLVSQAFYGTLLRQMRNSPFKSEIFSGGRGGEAFAPLLDQHLADHMARGAGRSLARSIVRHIERSRKSSEAGGSLQMPQPASVAPPAPDPASDLRLPSVVSSRSR